MISLLLVIIYIAFISLGLPDAVLGSAWPVISDDLSLPLSYMSMVSIIISAGTILSSLNSQRLVFKLGIGNVTFLSVLTTAIALFGFSISSSFLSLCLWAIPYGLGAGSVDAALNTYVAMNYESKHMSWLHCMWGIGATLGPYVMGSVLVSGLNWNSGYTVLFLVQAVFTVVLLFTRSLWLKNKPITEKDNPTKVLSLKEIMSISGVIQIMIAFFCYCAIEHTTGLWASTFMVESKGINKELAAGFSSLYYLGITLGRAVCGFLAMKFSDKQMIRGGQFLIGLGIVIVSLPFSEMFTYSGLVMIGLGCAPVYPCIIHSTPANFGVENTQAITGVQMASAYTGTLIMPALFGLIANYISVSYYPLYLGILLIIMSIMYQKVLKKVQN